MTAVEVLAPVRLETRFVAPEDRDDGVPEWRLRVRIYPDEFSIRRTVAKPVKAEFDRLAEAVAALTAEPPLPERDAFASFAASVGAARALALWRAYVMPDGAGGTTVDRSEETAASHNAVHGPAGLPMQMEIWLIFADGTRSLGAALTLDLEAIAADLDLSLFDTAQLGGGTLPDTWWLSYDRAVTVGLGADIDVGAVPPALDAVVAVGVGDTDTAELVHAHNATGRLAVLSPGTPTNTVAGEPTTDFGVSADSVYPLLHLHAFDQPATRDVLQALTGQSFAPDGLPLLGGHVAHQGPGWSVVRGLWPALWGRALRDVMQVGAQEIDIARWAERFLEVDGPYPAIRVGEQPYGIVPTSSFATWVDDADDPGVDTEVDRRVRDWAIPWRAGAAAAARSAGRRANAADTAGLLEVLGFHAPSRHWNVRPIADHPVIEATRALAGLPSMPITDWDRTTAVAWTGVPYPAAPIGPAARSGPVPGPPGDAREDPERLRELCGMHPESLYYGSHEGLGLVGRLFREALIAGRAIVGEAIFRWRAGDPVELGQAQSLHDEQAFANHVMRGDDDAVEELATITDENGAILADRFRASQYALLDMARYWEFVHQDYFRAVLAALDTASFRVDPWLTGVAQRRLRRMIADQAPFRLGAYGWVDAPAPYLGPAGGALAPGPTAAGLLHAPSHAQALTAALLRDAAVRYPGDERWRLTIDSAKVRASVGLAERVRLGIHPYEALGLEVEKVAGDWDTVRILRREYPLAANQEERRVCDGASVLRAAREGTLVAGLPADLTARLSPLDQVLDTYADLLVADGVHALVTGRADLANAAMEAAAGLGAPPDLRALRTPRAAHTVRVAAWALLEPGQAGGPTESPAALADPAFAALVAGDLGPGALDSDDAAVSDARRRLAVVLGGGDDDAPVPSLIGGEYEGLPSASSDGTLRSAMASDLSMRLHQLGQSAQAEHNALMALNPDEPGAGAAITAFARRWAVDLTLVASENPAAAEPTPAESRTALGTALAERVTAAQKSLAAAGVMAPTEAVNHFRRAVRALVGRQELPVLPIVERSLLPVLRATPDLDRTWLELVAAVRPRLAPLEAHQFAAGAQAWSAGVATSDGVVDPWHAHGPVIAAYGPAVPSVVAGGPGRVAIAALDGWTDSVPSRRHATAAAFGFNAPKSRAPQAVLVALPPDRSKRLTTAGLVDVVLDTRELAHARAVRPTDRDRLPYATPFPMVHASEPVSFLEGWPQ